MKSLPTVLLLPAAAISMLSSVPAGAEQAVAPAAVPTADAAAAQPATATAVATPEAAPAVAATAPAASQETAPACELHVFPTLEGAAVTTGWGVGFGMIGAMIEASANKDRNVRDAAYLKEALGPRLQVEALKTVDVPKALKFEPAQVIFETPIADRDITTKAETRLTKSTASCYAELIVTENLYHKAAISGRSLNNRFVFKDFRTDKTKTKLVKGRGGNGLTHFPPANTDETEAAEQDLRTAFAKNFIEFTNSLNPKT